MQKSTLTGDGVRPPTDVTEDRRTEGIPDEAALEERLSRPHPRLIEFIRGVSSPLVILGAGGKMGASLAVLAHRAAQAAGHPLEVIAVSRFADPSVRRGFEDRGVRTLPCDLLAEGAVHQLPDTRNLIYLVGVKFGTAQNASATWAANTLVPARVVERYPRARIVALSTGNVYPLSPVNRRGSTETDPLTPVGEYANSAVARERIFEFYSRRLGTPVALMRLFYAVELRYGVLLDIARKVWNGEAVELTNGFFNCIWQGDANDLILRSLPLAASPPSAWNLCAPQVFSVRQIATRLGELLERSPNFTGAEAATALLGNPARLCGALGEPSLPLETLLPWIAAWVKGGGRTLDKPTHFEVRDGTY